jgi:hypothetical protein
MDVMTLTASRTSAPGLAQLARRPYSPRSHRFIRRQDLGDWRMKVYGIAARPGHDARPELVEATVDLARQWLPQPALGGERTGIGFVIAHDAMAASIGIVYWWQSVNELHQRSFIGPLEDPKKMERIVHPGAGCVYELGIIDFERRAWLEDVLANPAGPDLERYLGRRYDADF